MAATFVVEDGTGKTDANSYVSLADADQYHENNSGSTTWSGATDANKQKALRLATQYVDARYNGRWRGFQATSTQALAWPRMSAYDNEGYIYDSDAVPQRLADAVSELALRVIDGDTLFEDQSKPGVIKTKSVRAGPISRTIEYMGGMNQAKKYPLIEALLAPLILASGVLERG